jgi:hypothetical protein
MGQKQIPLPVIFPRAGRIMPRPIQLNGQTFTRAVKIQYITTHTVLPSEFTSLQLRLLQQCPKLCFRRRQMPAQFPAKRPQTRQIIDRHRRFITHTHQVLKSRALRGYPAHPTPYAAETKQSVSHFKPVEFDQIKSGLYRKFLNTRYCVYPAYCPHHLSPLAELCFRHNHCKFEG